MIRALLVALALLAALPARAQVEIEEVTSPGGITRGWWRITPIPFVALDILFAGGTSLDPEDARGATYLMTGLLEEGAADMDNTEFAARSETLAAYFGSTPPRFDQRHRADADRNP